MFPPGTQVVMVGQSGPQRSPRHHRRPRFRHHRHRFGHGGSDYDDDDGGNFHEDFHNDCQEQFEDFQESCGGGDGDE